MNKKQNKGITLVALVITIIVLIILAGVSINAVMNDGLIENSKEAAKTTNEEEFKEKVKLLFLDGEVKSELGQISDEVLVYVKKQLKEQGLTQAEINKISITNTGEVLQNEPLKTLSPSSPEVVEFVAAMDDSLIYNEGYLTGLVDTENVAMYTKATLLPKLPEGADILDYNGNSISDTKVIGTGCRIVNAQGDIIAYTIFFGDYEGNGRVQMIDYTILKWSIEHGTEEEEKYRTYFAWADINGDEIIDSLDTEYMMTLMRGGARAPYYGNEDTTKNIDQFRPAIPNLEISYGKPES